MLIKNALAPALNAVLARATLDWLKTGEAKMHIIEAEGGDLEREMLSPAQALERLWASHDVLESNPSAIKLRPSDPAYKPAPAPRDPLDTPGNTLRQGAKLSDDTGWHLYLNGARFVASARDLLPEFKRFTLNVATLPPAVKFARSSEQALAALERLTSEPDSFELQFANQFRAARRARHAGKRVQVQPGLAKHLRLALEDAINADSSEGAGDEEGTALSAGRTRVRLPIPAELAGCATRTEAERSIAKMLATKRPWVKRAVETAAQIRSWRGSVTFERGDGATPHAIEALKAFIEERAHELGDPGRETVKLDAVQVSLIANRGEDSETEEGEYREILKARELGLEVSEIERYAPRNAGWATLKIDGGGSERVRLYGEDPPEREIKGEVKPASVQVLRRIGKGYQKRFTGLGSTVTIGFVRGRRTVRGDVWLKVVSGTLDGIHKDIWKKAPVVEYI